MSHHHRYDIRGGAEGEFRYCFVHRVFEKNPDYKPHISVTRFRKLSDRRVALSSEPENASRLDITRPISVMIPAEGSKIYRKKKGRRRKTVGGIETSGNRLRRLEIMKQIKDFRATKVYRRKGGAGHDIDIANIFRQMGLDFFASPQNDTMKQIPGKLEGRRVDSLTPRAYNWLVENFDVGQVEDEEGRILLHFPKAGNNNKTKKGEYMSLITDVAEHCDQPRKLVKQVMEAFVEGAVRASLKSERAVRIPGLGKLSVKFRPAKPKRKGTNPFTGKPAIFKAKPASNKLRFRPSKDLKKFVEKLPVVAPKKKHKKGKSKK